MNGSTQPSLIQAFRLGKLRRASYLPPIALSDRKAIVSKGHHERGGEK